MTNKVDPASDKKHAATLRMFRRSCFGRPGVILALSLLLSLPGYSQTRTSDITRCGMGIERGDDGETITALTIRLTNLSGLDNIPVGNPAEMMAWTSDILSQGKKQEEEGGDVTIKLKDVTLFYGADAEFDHALIMSSLGWSWNPATCGRASSNPNTGAVSIHLDEKMLEGQFSALLIVCDRRTAIKKATVSGSFQCALPVLHDPGYSVDISDAEAMREQAVGIWSTRLGAAGGLENIRRALPYLPGGKSPAAPTTAAEEWDCDCSCPAILEYGQEHRCRVPCGPEFRYEECRTEQAEEVSETEPTVDDSEDDPCIKWQKQLEGEGVPPEYAHFLQNMFEQMGKACRDMSPEERAALEQMLEAMAPGR